MVTSPFLHALPIAALLTASLTAPAAVAGAVVNRASEPSVSPSGLDPTTLSGELRASGFRVNPGYPMLYAGDACATYTYPAMKSCFGNNPVSPYVIPVVKAWPNEHVGPTPANVFGPVRAGYVPTYRLGPRDAIVVYGKMPPPGKYMALQTYEWSQPGHWKAKDYVKWEQAPYRPYPMQYMFETIPPDDRTAGRTWSFASIGDPVNNVVMQTQSGYPFGKNRYFITTPSASTDRAVRRVLRAQGVPDSDIFTERIPSRDELGRIGPLGMGKRAIDFYTFFRYAIPTDPEAAREWWADMPLSVLRVRAPSSLGPIRRYGMLTYGTRTAQSEAYLTNDLQKLVNAVCDRVRGTAGLRSADCTQPPPTSSIMPAVHDDIGWTAPYCRTINSWCGDQTDAGLFGTKPLPLDSGEVYAVVDALATETGNATYVGLSVNEASRHFSPAGVTDAALKGSANGYAGLIEDSEKFFVHYFTRDCKVLEGLPGLPASCTEISPDMVPQKEDTTVDGHPALRGMFWPGLREYIAPGTAHGPDTSKLLRPRILTFTKP
jgi:hypothetical protein